MVCAKYAKNIVDVSLAHFAHALAAFAVRLFHAATRGPLEPAAARTARRARMRSQAFSWK